MSKREEKYQRTLDALTDSDMRKMWIFAWLFFFPFFKDFTFTQKKRCLFFLLKNSNSTIAVYLKMNNDHRTAE